MIETNREDLIGLTVIRSSSSTTTLVACNEISTILEITLEVASNLPGYEVFLQRNTQFCYNPEIDGDTPIMDYKQAFKDYCNYYDKYREALIVSINKKLINYSNNMEKVVLTDYPTDIKMILVLENFNCWDLNSQYILARLSQKNPNIMVFAQVRTDLDYVMNHLDSGLRSMENVSFVKLVD